MALSISKLTETGAPVTYHRICALGLRMHDKKVDVFFESFYSEAAKVAGKQPLGNPIVLREMEPGTLESLYDQAKLRPEFEGAEDC